MGGVAARTYCGRLWCRALEVVGAGGAGVRSVDGTSVVTGRACDAERGAVGEVVEWRGVMAPGRREHRGAHALLRPVEAAADAPSLYEVSLDPSTWTYLAYGPYASAGELEGSLAVAAASDDPLFFAIVVGGRAVGVASYLRITPEHGVIEIGHIWFGAPLRRTTAATEAIFLLARHAFDELSYRRLEWKCDARNAPSRRAAERFGFTFEGIFRKHQVVKGRNRDTAWYAIVDDDWPAIRAGFEAWLADANFDAAGRQRATLEQLIAQSRTGSAASSRTDGVTRGARRAPPVGRD